MVQLQADVEALTKQLQASTSATNPSAPSAVSVSGSSQNKDEVNSDKVVVVRRRREVGPNGSEVDDGDVDSEELFSTGPSAISDASAVIPVQKQMKDSATAMTPATTLRGIEDSQPESSTEDEEAMTPEAPSPSTPNMPSAQEVALLQQKLNMLQRSSLRVTESYEKHSPVKKYHGQRASGSLSRASSLSTPGSSLSMTDGGDENGEGVGSVQKRVVIGRAETAPVALLGEMDAAAEDDIGEVGGKGSMSDSQHTTPPTKGSHAGKSPSPVGAGTKVVSDLQAMSSSGGNLTEASPVVVLYTKSVPNNRHVVSKPSDGDITCTGIDRTAGGLSGASGSDSGEVTSISSPPKPSSKSPIVSKSPGSRTVPKYDCDLPNVKSSSSVAGGSADDMDGQRPTDGGPVYFDSAEISSRPVLKEGFLMKRGYMNTALQRRWCVLRGKTIYYYRQYRDKHVRGTINCDGATVEVAVKKAESVPFSFYVHTPKDK
jgi:hypothetical protein